jgi:hypothetical protein
MSVRCSFDCDQRQLKVQSSAISCVPRADTASRTWCATWVSVGELKADGLS